MFFYCMMAKILFYIIIVGNGILFVHKIHNFGCFLRVRSNIPSTHTGFKLGHKLCPFSKKMNKYFWCTYSMRDKMLKIIYHFLKKGHILCPSYSWNRYYCAPNFINVFISQVWGTSCALL